jgi:hypothetical protein
MRPPHTHEHEKKTLFLTAEMRRMPRDRTEKSELSASAARFYLVAAAKLRCASAVRHCYYFQSSH